MSFGLENICFQTECRLVYKAEAKQSPSRDDEHRGTAEGEKSMEKEILKKLKNAKSKEDIASLLDMVKNDKTELSADDLNRVAGGGNGLDDVLKK